MRMRRKLQYLSSYNILSSVNSMHCHDQTTTSVKENKFRTKQTKEMPVSKMSDKHVFFLYSPRNNKICRKVYFDFLLSVQSIHKRFHLLFLKVWQKKKQFTALQSPNQKLLTHPLYLQHGGPFILLSQSSPV